MHGNKPMTKADKRRIRALKEMGCIACLLRGVGWRLPDAHHILVGGRRMGHQYTIALCGWHHEGRPMECGQRETRELLGPSLKLEKRRFQAEFGTELELLRLTDERLA